MTPAEAHARLERVMARAMASPDPVLALRRAARSSRLPPAIRRMLAAADEDGVRMAALLSAKLRFERLLRGCPEAEAWFERDAEGFAEAFRRYHAEVRPTAFLPPAEARLFVRWQTARQGR
jgi:hypothetical protein